MANGGRHHQGGCGCGCRSCWPEAPQGRPDLQEPVLQRGPCREARLLRRSFQGSASGSLVGLESAEQLVALIRGLVLGENRTQPRGLTAASGLIGRCRRLRAI